MANHRSKYYGDKISANRNRQLKKNYGISLDEWTEKFEAQGKMCAMCSTTEPVGKNWHTDHCHSTGKVRSILCSNCNTALGKFGEDPTLLTVAAIYSLVWNFRDKGGLEDLLKARHYIDILIGFEYGNERT